MERNHEQSAGAMESQLVLLQTQVSLGVRHESRPICDPWGNYRASHAQ